MAFSDFFDQNMAVLLFFDQKNGVFSFFFHPELGEIFRKKTLIP